MKTWLLLGATLLLGGCSAYQAGGPQPAFRSLEIAPVRNATSRTGTHAVLHAKLNDAFAGDPRVRLGGGDAVLATEVTEYRRDGFTNKPGDAFAFNSFRVSFEVRATLTRKAARARSSRTAPSAPPPRYRTSATPWLRNSA